LRESKFEELDIIGERIEEPPPVHRHEGDWLYPSRRKKERGRGNRARKALEKEKKRKHITDPR